MHIYDYIKTLIYSTITPYSSSNWPYTHTSTACIYTIYTTHTPQLFPTHLLLRIEVQASLLQHGEVLDEQPAILDALALPQLSTQLMLCRLVVGVVNITIKYSSMHVCSSDSSRSSNIIICSICIKYSTYSSYTMHIYSITTILSLPPEHFPTA